MEAFQNPPRVYKREIVDKMLLRNLTLYLGPTLELQEKLLARILNLGALICVLSPIPLFSNERVLNLLLNLNPIIFFFCPVLEAAALKSDAFGCIKPAYNLWRLLGDDQHNDMLPESNSPF
jgi:hypothetical protein